MTIDELNDELAAANDSSLEEAQQAFTEEIGNLGGRQEKSPTQRPAVRHSRV